MPNIDSLAEYLVKIGWDMDDLGYNKAKEKVKSFETGFVKAISNIASSMIELADSIANIDLAQERLARQFWIPEKAARSLSTSLDALGISYEDLFYATDEQYGRFLELNQYAQSLEATQSKNVDKTLVQIRDIQFEFSKMKVWFTYFTREVIGAIGRYINIPEIRKNLSEINDILVKNLPKIADWVGKIFSWVWRLGSTALKTVYNLLEAIIRILGSDGVMALGVFGGAIKLLKSGPLGWLIFALTALLLLIEDFMVWKSGGKSALSKLWEEIGQEGGMIDSTLDSLSDLGEAFKDLLDSIKELFNLGDDFSFTSAIIKGGLSIIEGAARLASSAVGLVVDALDLLTGKFTLKDSSFVKNITGFADWLSNTSLFKWMSGVSDKFGASWASKSGGTYIDSSGMVHEYDDEGNEVATYPYTEEVQNRIDSEWAAKYQEATGKSPYMNGGIGSGVSSGLSNGPVNNTQNNEFNITVNTQATDATGTANATIKAFNDMIRNRDWRLPTQ